MNLAFCAVVLGLARRAARVVPTSPAGATAMWMLPRPQHAAGHVGLVRVAFAQPLQGGVPGAERREKPEGELCGVERLERQIGYGFFDFDGVHADSFACLRWG